MECSRRENVTHFLIIIFIFFLNFSQGYSYTNSVLIVNSYHSGFSWTDNQVKGIDSAFLESGLKYDIEFKFLDTHNNPPTSDYFEKIADLFKYRISTKLPDIILTTDDDALNFVLSYKDNLFNGVPHVFSGVGSSSDMKLQALKNITGVYDDAEIKDNIDLAIKLFPETKNLVFVHDQTVAGKSQAKKAEDLIDKYPGYTFFFLTDMSMERLQTTLSKLPPNSTAFLLVYSVDREGEEFSQEKAAKLVSDSANCPVFGCRDAFVGQGILGGYTISAFMHGLQAGRLAVRILKGSGINNIPIVKQPEYSLRFDYNVLKKYNISESALPKGSIILNKPESFLAKYRNVVIPASVIILVQLLILIWLLLNIIRKRKALKALDKSEKRFGMLIHEAPVAIMISRNGKIQFANDNLLNMFGYKLEKDILSKSVIVLIAQSEKSKIIAMNQKREKGEVIVEEYETIAVKSDGTEFPVLVEARSITLPDGLATIGFFKDFTQIRDYTQKLENSEQNYRNLIDSIPLSIIKFSFDWEFLISNKTAQLYFNFSESEVLNKTLLEIPAQEDLVCFFKELKSLDLTSGSRILHTEFLSQKGETKWIELNVNIISDGILCVINDITDKVHAGQAIKEQAELLEHVSDAIFSYDNDFRIRTWNKAAEVMYGWDAEEVVGKNVCDLMLPINPEYEFMFKYIFEQNPFFQADLKQFRKDNSVIEVHCHLSSITGTENEIIGAVCVNRDITILKKTEEIMKLSKSCVDYAEDVILWLNADGTIIYSNMSASKILGYSPEEFCKLGAYDIGGPHSIEEWAKYWDELKNEGSMTFDANLITKSGNLIPFEINANYFEIGEKEFNFSFLRNITERKKHEAALSAEKERLAVTLRSIGDGVIVTDIDGKILMINKSAESLTDWKNEDAIGRDVMEVFKIIDKFTRMPVTNPVIKAVKTGSIILLDKETILISKNGRERIISDSGAPIRDFKSETIGVVLVFRDITDKIIFEKELEKAEKLRSIGVLAGGIAHDFNNILTAILNNLYLAGKYTEMGNIEKTTEILKNTEKATFRAKSLTHQLLTFSKGGEPILRPVYIAKFINEAATFALRGSNVKLQLDLKSDLLPVYVDEGQISQVIQNLVINAAHAMKDGGVVIIKAENTKIDSNSFKKFPLEPGNYISVSVTDAGCGIPEENLNKIFDPYFTTKSNGSGLGLATSFSIITKHNGLITVESEIDKGSVFTFYLPAVKSESKTSVHETVENFSGKARILVMDDDFMIRDTVSELINVIGYECVTADSGEQAIELYSNSIENNNPIDIIIMDLTIPGAMGGKEAIKRILYLNPNAKVIVSSGHSTDPIMSDYKKFGFSAVLTKPYEMKEFSTTIYKLLNSKEDENE